MEAALVLVVLVGAGICGYSLARLRPATNAPPAQVQMTPGRPVTVPPVPQSAPMAPGPQASSVNSNTNPIPLPRRQAPRKPPESAGNEDLLVKGLIGAYDVSQNDAVQAHVVQVLQRTGIERVVVPAGVEFDPSSYEAVSTEATSDPAQVKRVAKTIRPGWKGSTGMIRYAQVAVWVAPGADNDGTA